MSEMEPLSPREEAELAALADGSRADAEFAARVHASPRLSALLAEQRQAVALMRAALPPAPERLRHAVQARSSERPARYRGGLSLALATAGVLALTVVALLPGSNGLSVASAAALAPRGPTGPAPAIDPSDPSALRASAAGLRYPSWQRPFGWRAAGTRSDRLGGRQATTVFYAWHGTGAAYTIVSGSSLSAPAGAAAYVRDGVRLLALRVGGRTVVTWLRHGHSCVLSARTAPLETLLRLAAFSAYRG